MIVRITATLAIALSCSDPEFGSTVSPQPAATATDVVKKEITAVTSRLLQDNESDSVEKSWEKEGLPLVDVGPIVIAGTTSSTPKTMTYNEETDETRQRQHNRVREFPYTWQDANRTVTTSATYKQSETIQQRPLDILLVIDTSRSMDDEREGLGKRLSALLQHIGDSKWRVAITTTDSEQCLK